MVCNLEIVSETRKTQTQHTKPNTAHGGKKPTTSHQKLKRKCHTPCTYIQTYIRTHTPKKTKKPKSLIHDMRRTGNPSRWQIPSAWSWTFSSGIRSI